MSRIIFLGTDLHGGRTELASKTVALIAEEFKKSNRPYKIFSIQNEKPFCMQENTCIVPKGSCIRKLRLLLQGISLPIYLSMFRLWGHDRIATFWVANSKYHELLFRFLKLIGYKIYFTIISGYDADYKALEYCDKIICQSEKMKKFIGKKFPGKNVRVIYPMVDLKILRPGKKTNEVIAGSVPYRIKFLEERGINKLLKSVKNLKASAIFIFRGKEAYNYLKGSAGDKIAMIDKVLEDKELAGLLGKSKVVSVLYFENSPDMPLSAVEGMACGCAVLCTENSGLADIVKKEKCGIAIKDKRGAENALKIMLRNPQYGRNARKAAEKYFDKQKNLKQYAGLYISE